MDPSMGEKVLNDDIQPDTYGSPPVPETRGSSPVTSDRTSDSSRQLPEGGTRGSEKRTQNIPLDRAIRHAIAVELSAFVDVERKERIELVQPPDDWQSMSDHGRVV